VIQPAKEELHPNEKRVLHPGNCLFFGKPVGHEAINKPPAIAVGSELFDGFLGILLRLLVVTVVAGPADAFPIEGMATVKAERATRPWVGDALGHKRYSMTLNPGMRNMGE